MAGVAFDFFAQAANVDVDRAWSDEWCLFPHGVEKLIAGENSPAVSGKILQQAKLAHGGEDIAPLDLNGHGGDVDFQIAEAENFGARGRMPESAQHSANASDKFARTERLGDVVIAAKFKTFDPIGFRCFRREKDDGNRRKSRSLADVAAEFETIRTGQHDIEQEEGGHFTYRLGENRSTAHETLHLKSGGLQVVRDETGDVFLVFHHKDDGTELRRSAGVNSTFRGLGR